jgi:hypothetical protein
MGNQRNNSMINVVVSSLYVRNDSGMKDLEAT